MMLTVSKFQCSRHRQKEFPYGIDNTMVCNKCMSIRAGEMVQVKVPYPSPMPGDPKRRTMHKSGEFYTTDDNMNRAIRIIEVRCKDRELLLIMCEALEWILRITAVRMSRRSIYCWNHSQRIHLPVWGNVCVCGGGWRDLETNYSSNRQLIHKSSIINMIDSTLNFLEMRAGWCSN